MNEKGCATNATETTLQAMINELLSQNTWLRDEVYRLDVISNRLNYASYPKNTLKEQPVSNDNQLSEPIDGHLPRLDMVIRERRDIIESIKIAINYIEQAI